MLRWSFPLLFAVAACASAPLAPASPAPASPAASASQDVAALFAREAPTPLAKASVVSTNGKTKGSIEAAAPPAVKAGEGVDIIDVPIGTTQPIQCVLHQQRLDGAALLFRVWKNLQPRFDVRPIRAIDVEVAGETPVLFSDLGLLTKDAGPKNAAHLKLAVAVHPRHTLMCQHDEPGYSATFRRIVTGFVASLTTSEGADLRTDARFAEIQIVRIGDLRVGYSEHLLRNRKGGGSIVVSYTSLVVPRGTDLLAHDVVRMTAAGEDGKVLSQSSAKLENGEMTSDIQLTRDDGAGAYRYEGTVSGKPLSGTFPRGAGLASDVLQASLIQTKLLGGGVAQVEVDEYMAEANPTAPVHTVYRKQGDATVAAQTGPVTYTFVPDEHGWVRRAEIPMGPVSMVYERAWMHGSP
jgi:hypothetical protein